jgi:replicative DNA helicase
MTGFYRPIEDVVREYANWATSPQPRIPTGFPILDDRTQGGAAMGEVILFIARSSVGKTAVACNVVINARVPTVFFSLEMHGRYIAKRLASVHTGMPDAQVEYELRTTGRCEALSALVDDYPQLAIIDKPAMSLKNMREAMHEVTEAWGEPPQLVVMDYMELIGGVPSLVAAEKVDQVARKIKDFSREHDCVVLCLHQVGRGEGGAGAEPLSLTSARYGGETQADYVLGAYRPALAAGISQEEYGQKRWEVWLQFLKTRGGSQLHPAGMLHHFDVNTLRISQEWPKEPLFPEQVPA